MRPRPRIWRTIKWGGLAAAVVLAGAAWASTRHDATLHVTPLTRVVLEGGRVWVRWYDWLADPPPTWTWWVDVWDRTAGWDPSWAGGWECGHVGVPLWILAAACALASAAAWRLDALARRRARAGLCPRCTYNRAGLAPPAPCPECGAAAPQAAV